MTDSWGGGGSNVALAGLRGITITAVIIVRQYVHYSSIIYVAPSFMGIDSKHMVKQISIYSSILYVAPSFMGIDSRQ